MTYRSQWLPVTLFPEFTYFEPADDDNWRPAPPHVAFSKHTPVFVRVENGVLLLPTIPSCIQLIHRPSSNVGYFHHSVISTGVDFAHQRVADLAVAWLANDAPTALLGQKRARSNRVVIDRTVSISEALTISTNNAATVLFFQTPRKNVARRWRKALCELLGIPREFWLNRYAFAGPGWGTFYSQNGWSQRDGEPQRLISHRSIFNFAVDFLINLDVWNDMSFCYYWNDAGSNVLTCFDVPRGIESNVPGLLLADKGLAAAPYGLPAILLGPIIDRFSNRARLLSSMIRTTVEPAENQEEACLPEFLELYRCTRDSVVVTQCVKAGVEVVCAIVQAHDMFRDQCSRYATLDGNGQTSWKNFDEFDRTRNDLLYHKHEFQGLNLLAQALDARIQNSISLVFNTVAKQDSVASIELARAATRDSRSMKVIAFATVVFLPATFVSAIFGTNFFSNVSNARHSIQVSADFWIYWAITIPLTLLTCFVGIYWHNAELLKSPFRRKTDGERHPYLSQGVGNAAERKSLSPLKATLNEKWSPRSNTSVNAV